MNQIKSIGALFGKNAEDRHRRRRRPYHKRYSDSHPTPSASPPEDTEEGYPAKMQQNGRQLLECWVGFLEGSGLQNTIRDHRRRHRNRRHHDIPHHAPYLHLQPRNGA